MKHETSSYGRILCHGMFYSWPASWLIFSQARRKELPPKHHPYSRVYYHAPAAAHDTHNTEISVSMRELLTKKSFLSGIARITSPTPTPPNWGNLNSFFLTPKTGFPIDGRRRLTKRESLPKMLYFKSVQSSKHLHFCEEIDETLKIQLVRSAKNFGQFCPIFIL